MRIAPRALLCGTAWRVGGGGTETGFDELRELASPPAISGRWRSAWRGCVTAKFMNADRREASRLADRTRPTAESIGDPTLTVALSLAAMTAKHEIGEMAEVLRLAQMVIDLADGDARKGDLFIGSPLAFATAMRGVARLCWESWAGRTTCANAIAMGRAFDARSPARSATFYKYTLTIPYGVLLPDAIALRETAERWKSQSGPVTMGTLFCSGRPRRCSGPSGGPDRELGFELLATAREQGASGRFALLGLPFVDTYIAREKARLGDHRRCY